MDPTTPHEAIPWPSFDEFYELYAKKRGRPNAEKFWNRLTQKEKEECMAAVPAYVASTPDKTFRKDPERYLRHKAFQDEIIAPLPAVSFLHIRTCVASKYLISPLSNPTMKIPLC